MAEVLIKAQDFASSDVQQDMAGAYKAGMPVVVMEDGHQWGAAEGMPKFFVLKLPSVSVDRVMQFIEPEEESDGVDENGNPRTRVKRRRMWRILLENIPAGAQSKIATSGELVIGPDGDYTWRQFKNFMRNLRDNVNAGDI
jgi:hypothetical protein